MWPHSEAMGIAPGGQERLAGRIGADLGAGQDDAHGLGTRGGQPRPGPARLAVGRKRSHPGQEPQLRRARRVDDEIVIRTDLGEHAPLALPVVRLAGQHERPVGADARARPRTRRARRCGCRAPPTPTSAARDAGERRDTSPVSRAVGDHGAGSTARTGDGARHRRHLDRDAVERAAPGRRRRARSGPDPRPRRSDPPATTSAAASDAAAAPPAAPSRR